MAKKLRWLLLDANIVIELHRLGIWEQVVERCEIHLPAVVVQEAVFFEDAAGDAHEIDLSPYQAAGQIRVFETSLSSVQQFLSLFDPLANSGGYILTPQDLPKVINRIPNDGPNLTMKIDDSLVYPLARSTQHLLKKLVIDDAAQRVFRIDCARHNSSSLSST